MGVVDIDHKLAVHLAGRAACREGDGHGVLRRGAARDEVDVLQQVRAGRDAVGLAADLAGTGRAALVQSAAGIGVRAEGHGAQAGAVDALEVADGHLLLFIGRDVVFNRACAGHDDDRAGCDLGAAVIGGVLDGVRAGGSRRTVDHLADFAGRILGRRADRAGHGARGIERAVGRGLKGKGAGRDLRGGLDCRGKLAAVEQDIGVVLAERQRNVGRLGNRDGEHLFSGILLRADGRLSLDGDLTASLGRRGDGGAAVGADFAGKLDNILVARGPCDRIGLAGHVGQLSVDILLRHAGDGERLAGLYRSRFEGDLNVVLTSDGDDGLAGFGVLAVFRCNTAIEHIGSGTGDVLLEVGQNRTVVRRLTGNFVCLNCFIHTAGCLVAVHIPDHGFDRACRNRRRHSQIGNGVRDLIGRCHGLFREGDIRECHLVCRRNTTVARVVSVVEEFLCGRFESVKCIGKRITSCIRTSCRCSLDWQFINHYLVRVNTGLNLDLRRFFLKQSFKFCLGHFSDRFADTRFFRDLVSAALIDRDRISSRYIAIDLCGDRRRAGCDSLNRCNRLLIIRRSSLYLCNSRCRTRPLDAGVRISPIRFTVKQRVRRLDARGHFERAADHRGLHSGLIIAVLQAKDHRAVVQQCLQTNLFIFSICILNRYAFVVHDFECCNSHALILDADGADGIRTGNRMLRVILDIIICLADIVAFNADIDIRRIAGLVRLDRCRGRGGIGTDIQIVARSIACGIVQIQQLRLGCAGIAGHLRLQRGRRAACLQRQYLLGGRKRDRDRRRAADPEADGLGRSRGRGRLHAIFTLIPDLRRQRCAADLLCFDSRFDLIGRVVADRACGDLRAGRLNRDGIVIAGEMHLAVCQIACGHAAAAADRDSRGERSGVALIQRNRAVDITVAERQREGICVPHINREILRIITPIYLAGGRDPDSCIAGLYAGHSCLCRAAFDFRNTCITGTPADRAFFDDRRLDLDRRVRLDAVRLICSQCRRHHRQHHGENQQQAHESSKCTLHKCTSFNLRPVAAADFYVISLP